MSLSIRVEVVANVMCDECPKTFESRAPSRKAAVAGIVSEGWHIQRHRFNPKKHERPPVTETICPNCLQQAHDAKLERKAELRKLAEERKKANDDFRQRRRELIARQKGDGGEQKPDTETS